MTQNLVRQNTRQTQSQEAYNAKYNALAERYEKASAKHDKLEAEVARRKNKARQIPHEAAVALVKMTMEYLLASGWSQPKDDNVVSPSAVFDAVLFNK